MSTMKTEPGPGARPPAAPGRPRRRLDWLAGLPAALIGGLALAVGWAAPFLHRAVTDRPELRITLAPVYRAVNVASSAPVALSTATTAAYTVSVKDFGAKGYGITDDAPAIQATLDSVPATGGTVFVPAGDYRLGSSLVISHNGTTLTGVGAASILRLMDGVQKNGISLPEPYNSIIDPNFVVHNVTISRLTVDGNHNPIINVGQTDYYGIFAGQTSYLTLSQLLGAQLVLGRDFNLERQRAQRPCHDPELLNHRHPPQRGPCRIRDKHDNPGQSHQRRTFSVVESLGRQFDRRRGRGL